MSGTAIGTHQKALAINLDPRIYGTVAEIGAGQEVARWLFRVGGAAGTIAKSMSAYDMTVSDQAYGKAGRYVSRQRLEAMLAHEYDLLLAILGARRGADTTFFAFADTVSARNFQGTNECHGWIGLRFQVEPGAGPSDLLLHVNLMDSTTVEQQAAVGILGINLIHAAFLRREHADALLQSLHDGLSLARLEVDFVHAAGPAFAAVDALATGIGLVRRHQANAVAFDAVGGLVPPTELLHRRAVVIERGLLGLDALDAGVVADDGLLAAGLAELAREQPHLDHQPLALRETGLGRAGETEETSDAEIERRIRGRLEVAPAVLLTRLGAGYELTHYLRRFTREPVRFVAGAAALVPLFEERFYGGLPGGLIEGIGRLLADNVRLYVQPTSVEAFAPHLARYGLDAASLGLPASGDVGVDALPLRGPIRHLVRYLVEVGWLVPLAARRLTVAGGGG